MSFKIGDRVGYVEGLTSYNPDEEILYGTVSDLTTKGKVIVTWDQSWYNERIKPLEPTKLSLESDIRAAQLSLEEAFDKYRVEVEAKVNDAVRALEEASLIAKKAGCHVSDMVYKRVMQDAIYNAGWSGSSFSC